jgi:hypothetical protein
MPKSSEIDNFVRELATRVNHDFGAVTKEGESFEACKRCGKRKEACRKPDSGVYDYLPCKGFIG